MLFNTLIFWCFYLFIFLLYLLLYGKTKMQNILLLLASYWFYAYWDWRFLSLIIISTVVDYFVALLLGMAKKHRKMLLSVSIFVNLAILGFFKYYNFFSVTFNSFMNMLGINVGLPIWNVILPIGISFYTFQTMGYTIDVYRYKMMPERDFIDFALFVAFFPQLIAGPIERASFLLPQIKYKRVIDFEKVKDGIFLIAIGLLQKVLVADNAFYYTDFVLSHSSSGIVLFQGIELFSLGIYMGYAGYSNIARGIAKLLGFELSVNFNFPFIAGSITEFWHRWNITISKWFEDYCFVPLWNVLSRFNVYAAPFISLFVTFTLIGLWHGANMRYIFWGWASFAGIVIELLFRRYKPVPKVFAGKRGRFFIRVVNVIFMFLFFYLLGGSFLCFDTVEDVVSLYKKIITNFFVITYDDIYYLAYAMFIFFAYVVVDSYHYYNGYANIKNNLLRNVLIVLFWVVFFYLWVVFGRFEGHEFFYYKF